MSSKKYKGDDSHLLPAQQVEPYRLWFEFLKLALKDQSLKVNRKYYSSWGDVENLTFTQWWSGHWRKLFAVDIGVRQLDRNDLEAPVSGREIILRVPLYQDPKRTLAQVSELLEQNNASERLKDMVEGQFRLQVGDGQKLIHPSTRFLRNLPKVRLLLHFYRFWISHEGLDEKKRLEKTAISYFQWADSWNRKVREKKWNRPLIEVPFALSEYMKYLEERGDRGKISLYESQSGDVSDHRRQISRYLRKARKLASNVAKGQFPGQYE